MPRYWHHNHHRHHRSYPWFPSRGPYRQWQHHHHSVQQQQRANQHTALEPSRPPPTRGTNSSSTAPQSAVVEEPIRLHTSINAQINNNNNNSNNNSNSINNLNNNRTDQATQTNNPPLDCEELYNVDDISAEERQIYEEMCRKLPINIAPEMKDRILNNNKNLGRYYHNVFFFHEDWLMG